MDNLQKRLRINFSAAIQPIALMIFCLTIYPQLPQRTLQNSVPIFNKCWFYSSGESEITTLASDNDSSLYLSSLDGNLVAINTDTIGKLWESSLGGNIVSVILVDKENIYIVARKPDESVSEKENLVLYSLDKLTGITRWQFETAQSSKAYLYDTDNSVAIILTSGIIYSLAKGDGQLLWMSSLESNLSARPLKKTTEIILGTVNKKITYLSLKDGKTLQKFEVNEPSAVFTEDANENNLVIGDRKGKVWSLNKKKRKQIWNLRQGAEISNLLLTAQGLLICSFDNFVYLVSETNGKLIWKRRLPGRVAAEPQIKNSNIIISSIDEPAAFVLELSSGKLVNKITLEGDDFFTGESVQIKNLLVYTTRRGIFAYSLGEDCQ